VVNFSVRKSQHFDRDMNRIHAFMVSAEYESNTIKHIFEEIYISMKRLETMPYIGADLSNKTAIPNDYRYLMSKQYLIFYKVFEKEKIVRVYHVYHSKEPYLLKLGQKSRTPGLTGENIMWPQ